MNIKNLELPVSELRHTSNPAEFPFETTNELALAEEFIGQTRAVKSIEFGLSIRNDGYNIFVAGAQGTGRSTIIRSILRRVAAGRPVPDDWCYINNFRDPDRPVAVNMKAGTGREFKRDMERFIGFLQVELPRVFESEEYQERKSRIVEDAEKKKEALFAETVQRALELGFQLSIDRTGIVKMPVADGNPPGWEHVGNPGADQWQVSEEREKTVDAEIRDFLRKAWELDNDVHGKIHELNRGAARFAVGDQTANIKEKYCENPRIAQYLLDVEEDILDNLREFLGQTRESLLPGEGMDRESLMDRYKVNLIVDNGGTRGGPVVEEANPTYGNLIGRTERKARFGSFYTSFLMIRAGSLLRANGGYLVLNAADVLRNAFSWEALKRVSKNGEATIEDVSELYGAGTGIKPEPIPVSLKIILVGTPLLYYLLYDYDEDFRHIFKVRSDFDTQIKNSPGEKMRYANFIGTLVRNEHLLPVSRDAVAAIVDYARRLSGKKEKLSLRFGDLADLVREASYWAVQSGGAAVSAGHVDKALEEKVYRANLLDERTRELLAEGTIMVDVDGMVAGQVNCLSAFHMGEFAFGRPSRITARIYLGKSGVVDIEREAKLSGRIYNKSVYILSGYLGGTYAREKPLSLCASVAFEQSYGDVEGDSASAAELVALLSGIAELPVKQNIAITGSINQKGEVQPIGGVNEKIEGFYAVCRCRGLTGDQGVIIPEINVKNLMLNRDVVDAVREGKFHVYAVRTVNEALEVLTGLPAGERQPDGTYPDGTVNCLVEKRLKEMSRKYKPDDRGAEKKDKRETVREVPLKANRL